MLHRLFKVRLGIVLGGIILILTACSKNPSEGDVDDDDVDTTPPATIDDLHATIVTTKTVTLEWTAPGDDGDFGVAFEYDLRAAQDSITAQNFAGALRIDSILPPLPGGYIQNCVLDSLQAGQRYYFAIKTRDHEGNWSGLSNCAGVTCSSDVVVTFPDTALERVIREYLNKSNGDIYRSDVDTVTELTAPDQNIGDLSGLEYFSRLFWVNLRGNAISDLSPLEQLTNIGSLNVNMNDISDLSPLSGLGSIWQLSVGQNPIDDLSPLSGMTGILEIRLNDINTSDFSPLYGISNLRGLDVGSNMLGNIDFVVHFDSLQSLDIYGNGLTDISAVAGLEHLERLTMAWNQVSDLTPLANLGNLRQLSMPFNQISDLLPLVNNAGIGSGDEIWLQENPLSQQSIVDYIPALEARGVTIHR